jgi:hypothetical protein
MYINVNFYIQLVQYVQTFDPLGHCDTALSFKNIK